VIWRSVVHDHRGGAMASGVHLYRPESSYSRDDLLNCEGTPLLTTHTIDMFVLFTHYVAREYTDET
jgi:hypothetical protein